jgi:hypothetical protein
VRYTPRSAPGEGSVLPDGEYSFEVTNAEEKTSDSSGNEMIELTLKIENGPTVYDYLTWTEKSDWKLNDFRASIGENVIVGVPVDVNPDNWIGRRGRCVLYTDTYQGKKKNKVAEYKVVISGPGANPGTAPQKDKWR